MDLQHSKIPSTQTGPIVPWPTQGSIQTRRRLIHPNMSLDLCATSFIMPLSAHLIRKKGIYQLSNKPIVYTGKQPWSIKIIWLWNREQSGPRYGSAFNTTRFDHHSSKIIDSILPADNAAISLVREYVRFVRWVYLY